MKYNLAVIKLTNVPYPVPLEPRQIFHGPLQTFLDRHKFPAKGKYHFHVFNN